jgi:hypothetical protein
VQNMRTDETGWATIFIDDLTDGTAYKMFVTVGSNLPYTPTNLMEDEDIIVVEFTTPFNPSNHLINYMGKV